MIQRERKSPFVKVKHKRYSSAELVLLKKNLCLSDPEIASLMGRSIDSVRGKRLRMGWLKLCGSQAGSSHPMWKGGRTISSHGYVLIKNPEHHLANCEGYVYEHRLVAEQKLKRELLPSEIVHHKDGNRLNNTPENIEICSSIAFHKYYHRKSGFLRKPNESNPIIKCQCGCEKELLKYDCSGRPRRFISGHFHRPRRSKRYCEEKTLCACGCRSLIRKYDKYKGRLTRFVSGHQWREQNADLSFKEKQVYRYL